MDGSEKRKGICLPFKRHSAVTDPDREMRCGGGERGGEAVGGGEQSSRPLEKGGARSPKSFFRSFGPQYDLKIRGGGRSPCPSHGSATAVETHQRPLNSKTRTHECEIFSVLTSARL